MAIRKVILFLTLSFGIVFMLPAQPAGVKIPADTGELETVLNKANNGSSSEKGMNRYIIGYCCQNGILTEKDIEAALIWYNKSTAYNYVPAWLAKAQIFEDMDKPFMYMRAYYEAAVLGSDTAEKELEQIFSEDEDIIAGHYLARLYRKRMDMEKFIPVAYSNASAGDIAIQADLGYYLMNGCGGDREMFLEGLNLYENAAATDSVSVMHNLADSFGLPYDDDGLRIWYGDQAQEALVSIWYGLGMLYLSGTKYTQADPQKGVVLLLKAAEGNNTMAMEELVKCYSEGLGVKKDPDKAEYWSGKIEESDNYQYYFGF